MKELLKEVGKLQTYELNDLVLELFKTGKLNYVDFSKQYVAVLETENRRLWGSVSSLAMMLGIYCMNDKTNTGKTARRHLYESGLYTEKDGSGFGKKLHEEFKREI